MLALSRLVAPRGAAVGARGFATEKEIAMRITATKNIRKITASMKMVSASKLRGDQNRLDVAKKFGAWTDKLSPAATPFEEIKDVAFLPQKNVIIAVSSDKGLCGGVHSNVARNLRNLCGKTDAAGKEVSIICVGDKARSQLKRMVSAKLNCAFTDIQLPYSFALAGEVAAKTAEFADADAVHIAFNVFKSAIAYSPSLKTIAPFVRDGEGETLQKYEFEEEGDARSRV